MTKQSRTGLTSSIISSAFFLMVTCHFQTLQTQRRSWTSALAPGFGLWTVCIGTHFRTLYCAKSNFPSQRAINILNPKYWQSTYHPFNPTCKVLRYLTSRKPSVMELYSMPPNVQFWIDNIGSLPWDFSDDQFDFIHVRCMGGSIRNWPSFLQACFTCVTFPCCQHVYMC